MLRKTFKYINFIVCVGLVIYLMKFISWNDFKEIFTGINLFIIVLVTFLVFIFRVLLVSVLIKKIIEMFGNKSDFKDIFQIIVATLPLKIVLPFKLSEIARISGLWNLCGISMPVAVSSWVIFRVLTLAGILFLVFGIYFKLAGLVFVVTSFLVLMVLTKSIIGKIKMKIPFAENIEKVIRNLKLHPEVFILAILLSLGEIATGVIMLKLAGIKLDIAYLILGVGLSVLISYIPISIAGIGIRESSLVFALGKVAEVNQILAGGFLFSLVYYVFPAILGRIFVLFLSEKRIFVNALVTNTK